MFRSPKNIRLAAGEPGYPARLSDLTPPPPEVFLAGADLFALRPIVGIVGARAASTDGVTQARRIARRLAEAGCLVISGGALGIDAAAHRGALDAGRPTLVVLPTCIAKPGPSSNLRLFKEVLEHGGAWLSEHEVTEPNKFAFLRRNRLIAALADLILVIEARAASGTRHTVDAAAALGRPVAFLRWDADDPRGEGAREAAPASAATIDDAGAVLALLGRSFTRAPPKNAICEALATPLPIEVLARKLKRPLPALLVELTELELNGEVRALPGGRFERT